METLRNTQKEMLWMKNSVTEMKNALSNRWNRAVERIMTMKIGQKKSKLKYERRKDWKEKKKKRTSKNCGTVPKGVIHVIEIL